MLKSPFALAFYLGGLAVSGYAPFYLFPLPLLALAALFRLWQGASSPRRAALIGWAFGLGFFGFGVSWVYVSLHDFGAMPAPLAALATLLFCAFLALFPAAAAYLQARSALRPWLKYSLSIPALWVLGEWVRGWLFTGFPWLALGYSQVPFSPLAGWAPLLGVYGVSLAAALSAGLLALAAGRGRARWPALAALAVLWLCGAGLQQVRWTHATGAPVAVSLVQGDMSQNLKWREDQVRATLDLYAGLTLSSRGRLIVLPETALPLFYHQVPEDYLALLAQHARRNGGDLIVGLPEYAAGREYYNSAFSFGAAPTQTYRKYHLVPFGEYIPLRPVLGWIVEVLHIPLSDFSRGAPVQPPLKVAGQAVAMNICYEDVFGEEIINQLPQATLLVNISNDAWFGDSVAPWQHLQISQMRAVESGRYMLRATNTGVTAIIDRHGRVVKYAPEFTHTVLEGEAQGYAGATPYVRLGNGPLLGLLAGLLGLALGLGWKDGRKRIGATID
ncbi:MAG: apolipoprotein N-acyltransferase [Sulfuricellaceae bacterium]|nr:apolipoprotein N-acyltransferase [Sulfuricellaceae bacterium]